jgi:hypothetical protein
MRYARRVIESYVDLTYRGVSLGRRIKLTQVRPSSGYLELPAPMPVGTQLAIAADDGVAFDATVTWVYEQVAGADRVPGMIVRPRLTSDHASAWWTERVALPDEEPVRVTRTRPMTGRTRSHSIPAPATSEPERMPAIAADLSARVAAAAGLAAAPATPAELAAAPATLAELAAAPVMPAAELAAAPAMPATDASATVAMNPIDLTRLAQQTRESELEPVMRRTGEHDVVDDGYQTMIMASVDPAAIGLDAEVTDPGVSALATTDDAGATTELAAARDAGAGGDTASGDPGADDAAATRKLVASGEPDIEGEGDPSDASDAEASDGAAGPEVSEGGDAASDSQTGGDDKPPSRRGWFRRRNKRP